MPLIHQTDLFRPHMDPDDHWDLACVYALLAQGDIDLQGVLIDHPPDPSYEPDVLAVAQLNRMTGQSAPVAVGSSRPMATRDDTQAGAALPDQQGVEFLLAALRNASDPVRITIVGSCRDVALAANQAPELFRQNCAGIYLNAGAGTPDPSRMTELEYNVKLNKEAFAAMFDVPCPLFWMPCNETGATGSAVTEWATMWGFRQAEVLEHLSAPLRRYFASALGRLHTHRWMDAPDDEATASILDEKGSDWRYMWCTAGFLHAAGRTVTRDGTIVPLGEAGDDAVYTFEPISVRCDADGITHWERDAASNRRFIFHVLDTDAYASAMRQALQSLLHDLGQ